MRRSEPALRETLRALDVDPAITQGPDWELIEQAPPDDEQIGDTYRRVNAHLMTALQHGPLRIRHVTGEASALADPAHRQVVKADHDLGAQTALACSFEAPQRPTAWDFVARQHGHWKYLKWFDLVDMLALAARDMAAISRLRRPAEVHYSVAGDDLILLQEPHDHPSTAKWVWFVRSRTLADAVSPQIDRLFAEASPLRAGGFGEILDWLHSYEAFETVRALALATGKGSFRQSAGGQMHAQAELERQATTDRQHARALGLSDEERLTPLGEEWLTQVVETTDAA